MSKALKTVYIVGPTASGKSELAYLLAKRKNGVIISADSMQIYKGLDVGTAKESEARRREIKHCMIDVLPADASYSVAEYSRDAAQCIAEALNLNKLPIVVGGTGLYIESLIYPMSFAGVSANIELRKTLNEEFKQYGAEYMHNKLMGVDPDAAAKLSPNDVKRVVRALEINLESGKTLAELRDARAAETARDDIIMVGFNGDRALLYERINDRVDKMFENGLIEEVFSVGNFDCQSMQAIGYKEFASARVESKCGKKYISDEDLNEIKEKIKKNTRNYAKRQLTWFRKYPFVKWFDFGDFESAIEYIDMHLDERN